MVATFSCDLDNLDESISTARFAQRCSQLENEISKNEKIDLSSLVSRLEKEKSELLKWKLFLNYLNKIVLESCNFTKKTPILNQLFPNNWKKSQLHKPVAFKIIAKF